MSLKGWGIRVTPPREDALAVIKFAKWKGEEEGESVVGKQEGLRGDSADEDEVDLSDEKEARLFGRKTGKEIAKENLDKNRGSKRSELERLFLPYRLTGCNRALA